MNKLKFFIHFFLVILFIFQLVLPKPKCKVRLKLDPLKGVVVSFDKEKKTIKIKHEPVQNYMEAMTMDFPVRNEIGFLMNCNQTHKIQADLKVDDNGYWIEKIGIIAVSNPNMPAIPVKEDF